MCFQCQRVAFGIKKGCFRRVCRVGLVLGQWKCLLQEKKGALSNKRMNIQLAS